MTDPQGGMTFKLPEGVDGTKITFGYAEIKFRIVPVKDQPWATEMEILEPAK